MLCENYQSFDINVKIDHPSWESDQPWNHVVVPSIKYNRYCNFEKPKSRNKWLTPKNVPNSQNPVWLLWWAGREQRAESRESQQNPAERGRRQQQQSRSSKTGTPTSNLLYIDKWYNSNSDSMNYLRGSVSICVTDNTVSTSQLNQIFMLGSP